MYDKNLHRKRRGVQPPVLSNDISTCKGYEAQPQSQLYKRGQLPQTQTVAEISEITISQLGQAGMAVGQGLITLLRWLLMAFVVIRVSLQPENSVNMALLAIIVVVFIVDRRRG